MIDNANIHDQQAPKPILKSIIAGQANATKCILKYTPVLVIVSYDLYLNLMHASGKTHVSILCLDSRLLKLQSLLSYANYSPC